MYVTMCSCGKEIRTVSKEGKCKSCGQEFKLEWPASVTKLSPQPKTISEKYEGVS